jgi:hypothetical protein
MMTGRQMASAFGETPQGLSSQITNLAAVLTRKGGLKVPRYQRPYTWSEREVRELITDLWGAFKRNPRAPFYFIGQIVLVKNTKGNSEISDGQQRLATLTMLIAYVRDRLPHRAKQYQQLIMEGDRPRLSLRDDGGFFHGFVQEQGRMADLAKHVETGVESKDLLCEAAQTIESELQGTSDGDLDAFFSYVAGNCTLNVVDASARGCAQTVFNTLNKRGSPLSGADIIKSELIENSGLDEMKSEAAARKWEQIESMFERADFAQLLYMMPSLLTGEVVRSPDDLEQFIGAVKRSGGVHAFLFEKLPRYADALRAIFSDSVDAGKASADVNRRVHMMKQVQDWDWAPTLIAFLAEHGSDHRRVPMFVQALDRLVFGCELAVVDSRQMGARYKRIMQAMGDDRKLYGPNGVFELQPTEHGRFIETLNRARKRDRSRRLLMMRIEAAMPNGSRLGMTDDVTVEHVLPKGGSPWWNQLFPDPKFRQEAANLLGNLTLATHDQNKRADNKSYAEKRDVIFNTPGAPIHALSRDMEPVAEWTLAAIEDRQERLIRILCEDLGLIRREGAGSQAA